MSRQDIIKELKVFFDIRELICEHTYKRFGEKSWQFFDYQFLENLLILRRDVLQVPLFVNNWHRRATLPAGSFIYTQRGFRCNICQLVKDATLKDRVYLTSHANGAGVDAQSSKMTAQQMRDKIKEDQHKFTIPVRVEKGVSWLHFDIYDDGNGQKFVEFDG